MTPYSFPFVLTKLDRYLIISRVDARGDRSRWDTESALSVCECENGKN